MKKIKLFKEKKKCCVRCRDLREAKKYLRWSALSALSCAVMALLMIIFDVSFLVCLAFLVAFLIQEHYREKGVNKKESIKRLYNKYRWSKDTGDNIAGFSTFGLFIVFVVLLFVENGSDIFKYIFVFSILTVDMPSYALKLKKLNKDEKEEGLDSIWKSL